MHAVNRGLSSGQRVSNPADEANKMEPPTQNTSAILMKKYTDAYIYGTETTEA